MRGTNRESYIYIVAAIAVLVVAFAAINILGGSGDDDKSPADDPAQPPKETYTVTFNVNGGTGSMASQTVEGGGTATEPASTVSKDGYVLVGWRESGSSYDWTFDKTPV